MGVPGGKVDEGESYEGAAVRETFEEIGLIIREEDLTPVYSGHVPANSSSGAPAWVTTYLLDRKGDRSAPSLTVEAGLTVSIASLDELSTGAFSPFWEYNDRVRAALKTMPAISA